MTTTGVGSDRDLDVQIVTAILQGGVELDFQRVCGGEGFATVTYVEALARLRLADGRRLLPGAFLGTVECLGLFDSLTRAVLFDACDAAAEWPVGPDGLAPAVGVNVPPGLLTDDSIVDLVGEALVRSGLPAGRLVLEVTESVFVRPTAELVVVCRKLRALGVRLAMDDFGSGMSCYARLRELPIDMLKIDSEMNPGSDADETSRLILESIVMLGHALGLLVVIEGVEHRSELDYLARLGSVHVQGFALARPERTPFPARARLHVGSHS